MKHLVLSVAACMALSGVAKAADLPARPSGPPPFFLFSDNQVYFEFKPFGKEPGVSDKFHPGGTTIQKYIVGYTHFDVFQYGTNFANIEFLKSSPQDPPAGFPSQFNANFTAPNSGPGAQEFYGLYRGTLSGNALTRSKMFSFGIIKDVSLAYGFDANTKNVQFDPQKREVTGGFQLAFDTPGVFNVTFNISHEWNNNGILHKGVSFKAAPELEIVYAQPLTFTSLPLSLAGFVTVVAPKGRDGFGVKTKTELNSETRLVLDAGKTFGGPAGRTDIFVGYKYWRNKFGGDNRLTPGSIESTVFAGIAFHLF